MEKVRIKKRVTGMYCPICFGINQFAGSAFGYQFICCDDCEALARWAEENDSNSAGGVWNKRRDGVTNDCEYGGFADMDGESGYSDVIFAQHVLAIGGWERLQ